ncbi:hypothetical protein [Thalassorhabdomicrobium marinisediminis]|uniref:hypothetical protein n=1 Tax=Thalassorhabdomicrobium marinisediminis TaxID=2170577 RepID=UPI002492BD10|nr:hypothetical protein [Thalassorhabdomicrobium marinisediminis]
MFKPALFLIPLVALTACATPRERCVSSANRQVSTLDQLISETRGNISRGYGLVEVQDVRVVRSSCEGTNSDGTEFRFPCDETRTYTRQEPVTINVADEQTKLAQLLERRDAAARAAQAQVQQCIAVHPE